MKKILFTLLLCIPFFLPAQKDYDSDQLSINFMGIVENEKSNQIVLEVSNQIHTGNLYAYPGFILLDEDGDTLAKEIPNYYGIGANFQTHLLEVKKDIPIPFTGVLELHGSYYQRKLGSFPIELSEVFVVDLKELDREQIKVSTNYSNEDLIIDLSTHNINVNDLNYFISISNEEEEVVFESNIKTSIASTKVKSLGESEIFYLSIWDDYQKKLLPIKTFFID